MKSLSTLLSRISPAEQERLANYLAALSPRNSQIFQLILAGKTQREAGEIIGISQVAISRAIKRILSAIQTLEEMRK